MAELPERRVLKETLTDLKTKTIRSKSDLIQSMKNLVEFLNDIRQKSYELHESQKDKLPSGPALLVLQYTDAIRQQVHSLIKECLNTLDDNSAYIKLLESYSTELDKTLYDAIEAGKKEAKAQTEERSKLVNRNEKSYVT